MSLKFFTLFMPRPKTRLYPDSPFSDVLRCCCISCAGANRGGAGLGGSGWVRVGWGRSGQQGWAGRVGAGQGRVGWGRVGGGAGWGRAGRKHTFFPAGVASLRQIKICAERFNAQIVFHKVLHPDSGAASFSFLSSDSFVLFFC